MQLTTPQSHEIGCRDVMLASLTKSSLNSLALLVGSPMNTPNREWKSVVSLSLVTVRNMPYSTLWIFLGETRQVPGCLSPACTISAYECGRLTGESSFGNLPVL
jgi:hypothetical protein